MKCSHGEVVADVARATLTCRICGASATLPERERPSHTVGYRPVDSIVEFEVDGVKRYGLTAKGLEALGRPDLADEQRAAASTRLASKSITNRVRVNGPTGISREGVTLATPNGLRPTIGVFWPDGHSEQIERRYVVWLDDDAPAGAGDSVEADRG